MTRPHTAPAGKLGSLPTSGTVVSKNGAPARFDATAQHRRSMIAKVHVAKSQLRMTTDDYRQVLLRITGQQSSADCNQVQLAAVIAEMKRLGFSDKARPRGPRPADHPSARKARAMWISLALLGAIHDPSDRALEAFARRQIGCDRLQWANQALIYKLVEALKAIAERHGWSQSVEGVKPIMVATVLKRRLCAAILTKLRADEIVPDSWSVERAAFEFAGLEIDLINASDDDLDLVARSFGRVLGEVRS